YIESPNFGTFELQSGLEDANASPFGWHDTNGVAGAEYTFTRGNNVHAFLDRNWDYQSDRDVDGGANLIFDFPYNPDAEPSANEDLAATNLFVRNNFMHDFTFRYGFNEESGNFQQTNYSGAGLGNDYVIALCQFGDNDPPACGTDTGAGECSNNASFATQDDGINGLMTMYTWYLDNTSRLLDVIQPLDLAGKITSGTAQFGPAVSTTAVTGEVVQMNDGTSDGTKGCFFPEGQDLTGKIALIDRGVCDFSLKVYNAQEAGAIGAIICNFEDAILTMAPGDNAADVTIPSVIIGSIDCNRIRVAAGTGLVASLVAPIQTGPVEKDGSIDNSVISHEFGHGISTRLTGGPSNSTCLQTEEAGGMGEGWSDFFALATSVQTGDTGIKKRGIGTYVVKESAAGDGIRSYPYCTDMAINPHTYTDVASNTEVHAVGEVWCTMLWDMYWAFVEAYGLDLDPVHGNGGNNIAIQLVMDGLKLQVCGPSFTDARDAILKADSLDNGGANQCLIWKVFARRGLGYDANAGDPNSAADGKAGFDLPVTCLDDL
ncbi:MAG TPA: M36 family metallopeptidase, partial [Saprospiraceae bacterium]|nr:M36 family metallopeptidase [Saprospiraceae bacterium]